MLHGIKEYIGDFRGLLLGGCCFGKAHMRTQAWPWKKIVNINYSLRDFAYYRSRSWWSGAGDHRPLLPSRVPEGQLRPWLLGLGNMEFSGLWLEVRSLGYEV